jgi:Tfp pilus assembly protein PilF
VSKRDLVFLSYAHEDLPKVWKVYECLKKRNLKLWFDKVDLKFGDPWKPEILKAINRSRFFVIFISNNALKKTSGEEPGFKDEELQYALQIALNQPKDKFKIVPVRLEDCQRGDHRIEMFHQCDLFPNLEKSLDQLAVQLGGCSLSDAEAKDERTEEEKLIESMIGKWATLFYSGEYEKSLSILEAVINIKPNYYIAWYNKGIAFINLRLYDEARKSFDKAIEIEPDYNKAWNKRGIALINLRLYDEARKSFDKAIEIIKPDYAEALNKRGIALINLRLYDEALKSFDRAIEIKPDNAEAYNKRGIARIKLGRHDDALEDFEKAIEIKPDYAEALIHKEVFKKSEPDKG